MRRTLLAVACLFTLGAGLHAANVARPQQEKLVAADFGPQAATVPPVMFAPTTTTTTTTTTTVPPPTTDPPRPVDRPARVRPTATRVAPQPSPQPVEIPTGFSTECMAATKKPAGLAHACWDGLLASYPWNASTAFSVMMCESEGNPYDVNRSSGATGLMQIVLKGASTNPVTNMKQAWDKYVGSGGDWDPWVSSASCWRNKQKG